MSKVDWSTAPEGATHYASGIFWRLRNCWECIERGDNTWRESIHSPRYHHNCEERPLTWPENDTRITHIAQNGGDGLHYDEQREQHEAHYDPVNNPKHYAIAPGVEAIDIIEASLTPEQFKGYLLGNFLKYRLRAGDKGNLQQDIDKSNWYRGKLTGQTSKS